jgi:phenylacetyl-CoA:acceptor oxidoreductase subunit 2
MSRAVEQIRPAPQPNWDARAAANFIGGGAGSGLLIAAACAQLAGMPYRPFAVIGLVLIAAGLTCVWHEIGRPLRALHVFLHARTSWMTREAMVALPLFAAGAVAVWQVDPATVWLTALLAAAFVFCQAQILHAAKGIPAWRSPRIVPLIIATGLAEGTGLLLIGLAWLGEHAVARGAAVVLAALIGARLLAWRAYRSHLQAPRRALEALDDASTVFHVIGNWVVVALSLIAALAPDAMTATLGILAGAAAAAAGAWFKLVLVTRAAYNQGFALPQIPVRGRGHPRAGGKPGW